MTEQQREENKHRVGPGGLAVINLHWRERHHAGGDQPHSRAAYTPDQTEKYDDARERKSRGHRTNGQIGISEEAGPGSEGEEIEGRMCDTAQTGPDMPPRGSAGEPDFRRRFQNYSDGSFKKLIASSGGEVQSPVFINPKTLFINSIPPDL